MSNSGGTEPTPYIPYGLSEDELKAVNALVDEELRQPQLSYESLFDSLTIIATEPEGRVMEALINEMREGYRLLMGRTALRAYAAGRKAQAETTPA